MYGLRMWIVHVGCELRRWCGWIGLLVLENRHARHAWSFRNKGGWWERGGGGLFAVQFDAEHVAWHVAGSY